MKIEENARVKAPVVKRMKEQVVLISLLVRSKIYQDSFQSASGPFPVRVFQM